MPMTPPASLPPERPSPERPDVVVVGLSARALAAAARRAGRRPAAIDLFADADTQQLASPCIRTNLDSDALLKALARPDLQNLPLVYGTGFEDNPSLLARIAEDRPLLGNSPAGVARVKDPFAFADLLERLGIPHPPVTDRLTGPTDGYLLKRIGGSGGGHITAAFSGRAPPGCYFQRQVDGAPVSVLFLGDGERAVVIGFSRQWPSPAPGRPYRYGGVAAPLRLPESCGAALCGMVARLTEALGLVGLNSADFLLAGSTIHLLEINPRPGASLDVFDREPLPPLFGLHVDACAGRGLPLHLPALRGYWAAMIHYAAATIHLDTPIRWPSWTADRPTTPARIEGGQPVMTVQASGGGMAAARRLAERRRRHLMENML